MNLLKYKASHSVMEWYFTGSPFGQEHYLKAAPHNLIPEQKMLELFLESSNRQVNIDFTRYIYPNTGVYGFSFDVQLEIQVIGGDGYHIQFSSGTKDEPKRGIAATEIVFHSNESVQVGRGYLLKNQLPPIPCWYRVHAFIDTDMRNITWFMNDTHAGFIDDYTNKRGLMVPFEFYGDREPMRSLKITGTGLHSKAILRLDNINVWQAESQFTPALPQDLRNDNGYETLNYFHTAPCFEYKPEATPFEYKRLSITVGPDSLSRNFAWQVPNTYPREWGSKLQVIPEAKLIDGLFPETGMCEVQARYIDLTFGRHHSYHAEITGLAPDEHYVYRVGGLDLDGEMIWSRHYCFRTQSAAGDFEFLVIADPQVRFFDPQPPLNLTDLERWTFSMQAMQDRFPDASFMLSVGDQVESPGFERFYDIYFGPEQTTYFPLAPTVGNHDYNCYLFPKHFNLPNTDPFYAEDRCGPNYWYVYNNTLFMHLNLGYYETPVNVKEHDRFIADAIAANPEVKWRVVSVHFAVYGAGYPHAIAWYVEPTRRALYPIFDKHAIDIVLNGHEHIYVRSHMMRYNKPCLDEAAECGTRTVLDPAATLYITFPSAAGNRIREILWPEDHPHKHLGPPPWVRLGQECWVAAGMEFKFDEPAFSHISVTDTEFTIITYNIRSGKELDRFTVVKSPGAPKWRSYDPPGPPHFPVPVSDFCLPNRFWRSMQSYDSMIPADESHVQIVGTHPFYVQFWGLTDKFPKTDLSRFAGRLAEIDFKFISKTYIDNLQKVEISFINSTGEHRFTAHFLNQPLENEWVTAEGVLPKGLSDVVQCRLLLTFCDGYNANAKGGGYWERLGGERAFYLRNLRVASEE